MGVSLGFAFCVKPSLGAVKKYLPSVDQLNMIIRTLSDHPRIQMLFDNSDTSQSTASSRFVPAAAGQMALPIRAEPKKLQSVVPYCPKPGGRIMDSTGPVRWVKSVIASN